MQRGFVRRSLWNPPLVSAPKIKTYCHAFISREQVKVLCRSSHLSSIGRMKPFDGENVDELKKWLEDCNIDTARFGQGNCKTLQDLWIEVQKGESYLEAPGGTLMRRLEVLNLLVSTEGSDKVLMEAEQKLPSGAVRHRRLPLAEKLLPGESWQDGVKRAISEELGSVLVKKGIDYNVDTSRYRKSTESWVSTSYPGVKSTSVHHTVPVEVKGLPLTNFWTHEERSDGFLETHWVWVEQTDFT